MVLLSLQFLHAWLNTFSKESKQNCYVSGSFNFVLDKGRLSSFYIFCSCSAFFITMLMMLNPASSMKTQLLLYRIPSGCKLLKLFSFKESNWIISLLLFGCWSFQRKSLFLVQKFTQISDNDAVTTTKIFQNFGLHQLFQSNSVIFIKILNNDL